MNKPWKDVTNAHIAAAAHVPALLSAEEKCMLVHYGQTVTGTVVELGSFFGGSLAHFALGARDNPNAPELHAFDRFKFDDRQMAKYFDPLPDLRDLALVRSLVDPIGNVHFHQGELADANWDGSPIALLFIDIAKNPRTMDLVAAKFYPFLIDGAVIIHQDYQFAANPWVPIHTEQFADVMTPIAWVDDGKSVVFEWRAGLDAEAIAMRSVAALDDPMRDDFLMNASKRFAGSTVGERVDEMVRLTQAHGHWKRAHDYFRLVYKDA